MFLALFVVKVPKWLVRNIHGESAVPKDSNTGNTS